MSASVLFFPHSASVPPFTHISTPPGPCIAFPIHPPDALILSHLSQSPDSHFHLLTRFHFPTEALQYIYRLLSTYSRTHCQCCLFSCFWHFLRTFPSHISVTHALSVTSFRTFYPCLCTLMLSINPWTVPVCPVPCCLVFTCLTTWSCGLQSWRTESHSDISQICSLMFHMNSQTENHNSQY